MRASSRRLLVAQFDDRAPKLRRHGGRLSGIVDSSPPRKRVRCPGQRGNLGRPRAPVTACARTGSHSHPAPPRPGSVATPSRRGGG